ncbi:MAG: type I-C CRISPR-associated protein Cas5 [Candidatus Brocadia sp.]|nr:CRISPR pre-crRNA endoribonuclease Cas5d [Anaerolineales bacterium]MCC6324195.1 type I-C CRISPR-associated protein Cas5 [Candidatus Brocadia sp.]MCE7911790.1 type I-C CRISPR-associated protein Cas5 [Candidatus Brocadia sp. AMX3]MDG5995972.1 type I-C CRISPR-associated protein Cas5 [Candidatus Brocadia sp.]RIJ99539.1 MAG: type I-C CRISPR-associated protein Cas5 [Candidatus Brocadia sp.]
MEKENRVEFKVSGKYALFTDPLTKIGGEKCSYHIPTYEALKGVLSSVYWKPTIVWIIDKVRVMKRIRTQTRSAKPVKYGGGGNDLAIYTYLADVEYHVQAHFNWNINRKDMEKDRNENKHFFVAKRMIDKGGRRDIFLGARECQAYIEPCKFGEGKGDYDNYGEIGFDLMFHGFDYPDEIGKNELHARFWRPKMIDGKIDFIRPEACTIRKLVRPMKANPPKSIGLEEDGLLEGCEGMEVME